MSKILMYKFISVIFFGGFPCLVCAFKCSGNYRCCPGYVWNKERNKCIECRTGYVGINCNYPCPFPSYGVRCQSTCVCENALCHHIFGCVTSTTMLGMKSPVISSTELPPTTNTQYPETTTQHVLSTKPGPATTFKYLAICTLIITLLLLIFCLVQSSLRIIRYFKGKKHNLPKIEGETLSYETFNYETFQRQSENNTERSYEQLETTARYEGISQVTLLHDVEKCTYIMQFKTEPLKATIFTQNQSVCIPKLTSEKNETYLDPIFQNNVHKRHSV